MDGTDDSPLAEFVRDVFEALADVEDWLPNPLTLDFWREALADSPEPADPPPPPAPPAPPPTIQALLDAFVIDGETPPAPANAPDAPAGAAPPAAPPAATPSASPAGATGESGSAQPQPPPPAPAPAPSGATNVSAAARPFKKWHVERATLEAAEKLDWKAPAASGAPPLEQIELSEEEYKSHNLEFETRFHKRLKVIKGYRQPYVKRLDPVKDKDIIEGVTAARAMLRKVPIDMSGKAHADLRWDTSYVPPGKSKADCKPCVGHGWIYTPDRAGPYFQWLAGRIVGNLTDAYKAGVPQQVHGVLATIAVQALEGTPSVLNTYDGCVLTMGYGHALGADAVWEPAQRFEPRITRALYLCGLRMDYEIVKAGPPRETNTTYQLVDLSDPASPKVLVWDNYLHFYGWLSSTNGTKQSLQAVRPRNAVEPETLLAEGQTMDAFKSPQNTRYSFQYAINNHGDAARAYNIYRYFTNKDQKDIELVYALIDLAEDPLSREAVFRANWEPKAAATSRGVGMFTAYGAVFVALAKHEFGLTEKDHAGYETRFLSDADAKGLAALRTAISEARAGRGSFTGSVSFGETFTVTTEMIATPKSLEDAMIIADALMAKAFVRALASMWEKNKLATAVARLSKDKDKKPISFNTDDIYTYDKQWRFHTLLARWNAMFTGSNVRDKVKELVNAGRVAVEKGSELEALLKSSYGIEAKIFQTVGQNADDFNVAMDVSALTYPVPGSHYQVWSQPRTAKGTPAPPPKFYNLGPKEQLELPAITRQYGRGITLLAVEMDDAGKKPKGLRWQVDADQKVLLSGIDGGGVREA